ncbi:heterokaryon incompatibility protein-domain-containing protein [Xylaria cf. heliscus]|nr:heterokaryon incompatibility protein-domain-containing protein [Xylaria cf. heliscus]
MNNETQVLPGLPEKSTFCTLCCEVDAALRSCLSGHSLRHPRTDYQDVYLGKKSELIARSHMCHSCCAFVSRAEEDLVRLSKGRAPMFAGDYDFSAHVMGQNPVLWVAFGSLPSETTNVVKRRQGIRQLGILWLFSTDQDIPEGSSTWLAGTPRLFDPQHCNPSIVKEWLRRCSCYHGDRCLRPAAWLLYSEIRRNFIDVELECIVTPVDDVPFIALSYVWGRVETLQALKGNIDALKRPGSLSKTSSYAIPRTISDAMQLCVLSGQRYLWVDRVCIIQDDYNTKQLHLEAMAETYAKAEFTIVAADGSDANHGLSGFGQSTEERQKHLIPFPSKPLVRGTVYTFESNVSFNTAWSSRAWTFQEHAFSRRLLYIDKFVNWICASARWTETLSPSLCTSQSEMTESCHRSSGEKLFVVDWPSLAHLASLVGQYNVRDLTYDSDASNAFVGLLTQMCEGFPSGFFGGIPEFYFTICLLWQPQECLRPRFNQPNTSFLPTWSWLGWSGALDLRIWTCNTDTELPPAQVEITISPLVEWFKAPDRRSTSRIDDSYITVRKHFLENAALPPDGWQKHDGDSDSDHKPYYTYHNREHIGSARKFRYPIPPSQRYRDINPVELSVRYLYSRVQKAVFVFGEPEEDAIRQSGHSKNDKYDVVELPLYTTYSTWAGSIRVHAYKNNTPTIGQRCEVIRIAKGSIPINGGKFANVCRKEDVRPTTLEPHATRSSYPFEECVNRKELSDKNHFDFYFVLWIRWDGDTACRRALGVIWEPLWDQAEPEVIDIKLG